MRKAVLALVAASLLLAALAPAAAARATRTDFVGFVFPAGAFPVPGVTCPTDIVGPLPGCYLELGRTVTLENGGLLMRDFKVMDVSLAWDTPANVVAHMDQPNVPGRTGYIIESFNANLDASGYGPVWGSWELHDFASTALMFSGHFTGTLGPDGFNVQQNAIGHGDFKNQHMWASVVPGSINLTGEILDTHPD